MTIYLEWSILLLSSSEICIKSSYPSVPMYYSFPSRHSDGYRLQLDSFLDVVNGCGESSVTAKMTIAISRIADACENSARYVRTVTIS